MSASSLKPLNQQVVVVTGASSGIGLCTAKLAAERGAKVGTGRAQRGNAQETGGADHKCRRRGDLRCRGCCRSRQSPCCSSGGTSPALAASTPGSTDAGVSIYGRLDEVSDADRRRLFDTNFWGVVNGSLAALPHR